MSDPPFSEIDFLKKERFIHELIFQWLKVEHLASQELIGYLLSTEADEKSEMNDLQNKTGC